MSGLKEAGSRRPRFRVPESSWFLKVELWHPRSFVVVAPRRFEPLTRRSGGRSSRAPLALRIPALMRYARTGFVHSSRSRGLITLVTTRVARSVKPSLWFLA